METLPYKRKFFIIPVTGESVLRAYGIELPEGDFKAHLTRDNNNIMVCFCAQLKTSVYEERFYFNGSDCLMRLAIYYDNIKFEAANWEEKDGKFYARYRLADDYVSGTTIRESTPSSEVSNRGVEVVKRRRGRRPKGTK